MPGRENAESAGRTGKRPGLLSGSAVPRPLRADIKRRAAVRLMGTRFGRKAGVARRLALAVGRSVRSVLRWQQQYQTFGSLGLSRSRSDRGISRIISDSDFEALRCAAGRIRYFGDLAREHRSLGLPGSYRTFCFWVRRLQAQPHGETREAISA